MKTSWDVVVIGAGPAGLAAAASAKEAGAADVLIIERDSAPGGILQQCIHPGFGLTLFNEELTGPEYAGIYIDKIKKLGASLLLDTMVLKIEDHNVCCAGVTLGCVIFEAKSIVLAMGCRERTRGNLAVPGTRPAGVFTAGAAQRLLNRQGIMPGNTFVIVGSGDIGMIMARRLTLEGGTVKAVVELLDYTAGLTRNRVQCLDDFGIPLLLSHTITEIVGNERVEAVKIAQVGQGQRPLPHTERLIMCDTVLFSVGLIPENELSRELGIELSSDTNGPAVNQFRQTSLPWVYACGNVAHVNDLADHVSVESEIAGRSAARYAQNGATAPTRAVKTVAGENVRYVCPQRIDVSGEMEDASLFFRVQRPRSRVAVTVQSGGRTLYRAKSLKVNPGEMEQVRLNTDCLVQLEDDIVIAVQEE